MDITEIRVNLRDLVRDNVCYADVAKELGKDPRTVKKMIAKEGIDISHFLGKAKFKGRNRKINKETSKYIKNEFVKEGTLMNQCYTCGQEPFWNGKPMVLRMVHLDGNSKNNEVGNLIMQCPNCFSQIQGKHSLVFLNSCGECNKSIPQDLTFCAKCRQEKLGDKIHFKIILKNELVKTGFDGVRKKFGMDKEEIIGYMNS